MSGEPARSIGVVVVGGRCLGRVRRMLVLPDAGTRVLAVTADASAGAAAVARLRPDVVIAALSLPDGAGTELASRLRQADPDLGIVLVTGVAFADDDLLASLYAGASACISAATARPEFLAVVRHAADAPLSFSATGLADVLARRSATPELTTAGRQMTVLRLVADGRSPGEIAAATDLPLPAARSAVARLYATLGVSTRDEAVARAVHRGILRPVPSPSPTAGPAEASDPSALPTTPS
jgi:DNA-binding NarL/FixJ family response regulator